jgi:hypothetical protein
LDLDPEGAFPVAPQTGSTLQRGPNPSGLYDVLDLILDKGLVIDLYVRVSLVGIELLTIDARIVVASVDTYLRFAEAVNRLDLSQQNGKELPEFLGELQHGGARRKVGGALEGVKEKVNDVFNGEDDDDDGGGKRERQPVRRKRPRSDDGDES